MRLWAFLHLAPSPVVSRLRPEQQGLAPARLDQLIAAMRAVPGFQDFLAPVPARRLMTAASEGPVVVLNAAARHCDALLVTRDGVSALRLPGVTVSGLSDWAEIYQTAMGEDRRPWDEQAAWSVLGLLGDHVVEPILEALGIPHTLGSGAPAKALPDALPRMWWCPTAPFTNLPLQLAGRPQDNALDHAVHSYTSSLQALTAARSRVRHTALDSAQAMLLVLADGGLPYGRKEINETRTRIPLTHVLQGAEATDANVAELIADFPFFHFVGRVRLDDGIPRLQLFTQDAAGGPLPAVGDGALAYLSVRDTMEGGMSREYVGWALATRFQAMRLRPCDRGADTRFGHHLEGFRTQHVRPAVDSGRTAPARTFGPRPARHPAERDHSRPRTCARPRLGDSLRPLTGQQNELSCRWVIRQQASLRNASWMSARRSQQIRRRRKPCSHAKLLSITQRCVPSPVPWRVPRRTMADTMPRSRTWSR